MTRTDNLDEAQTQRNPPMQWNPAPKRQNKQPTKLTNYVVILNQFFDQIPNFQTKGYSFTLHALFSHLSHLAIHAHMH